ncbi:MAG TPA: MlaD family protein [Thermoleophilaceae bacterium]|nr:MlaD family protein [Thermoleophilaceae bacterium]
MRRLATGTLLVIALVGAAVFAVGAGGGGGGSYQVRAIFDDVASAVPGEDVKVAGAKIGAIESMDVTPQHKAAVVLNITDTGFAPFHDNAHCTIRPQSLIGEKYVECDPGSPQRAELKKIDNGPGEGQYLLPLKNTSAPVDLDLVNNVMRLPYRQRFAIILNELGAGFAGRGQDLNELIHRANPALRETDRVLQQLADENTTLKNLAAESDRALAPLARDRRHLSGFIENANELGEATAARRAQIERSIQKLPEFLRQLKPTMQDLGRLADQMAPTLTDLDRAAPSLARFVRQLGPFSRSATRSLTTLGQATDVGGPVLQRARPVVQDLKTFASNAKPVSKNLDDLTASLDKTGGLEQAMNYVFFQMTAINGFDEISHYLRASLLVNTCTLYASAGETPACGAHFTKPQAVRSSSATAALDNKGNAPKQAADSPARALAQVVNGLRNLTASPTDAQARAQGKAGIERLQQAAAKGTSPALDGVGGRDAALLDYLMGSG